MATLIDQRTEQAVDLADLEMGQDREQGLDGGQKYLSAVFSLEFAHLRRMNDPQARKLMKQIMAFSLVEVLGWPIETVCQAFSVDDHPPMGNATCERWLTSAQKYLQLRLPVISDEILDTIQPSDELRRNRDQLVKRRMFLVDKGRTGGGELARCDEALRQLDEQIEDLTRREKSAHEAYLFRWREAYREACGEQLEERTKAKPRRKKTGRPRYQQMTLELSFGR
jgi:hypothetical protein